MKPGASFREASVLAWRIPNAFVKNRYSRVARGVGLCDEWASISHLPDREARGYDSELHPGMTICVERYIGDGRVDVRASTSSSRC